MDAQSNDVSIQETRLHAAKESKKNIQTYWQQFAVSEASKYRVPCCAGEDRRFLFRSIAVILAPPKRTLPEA